VIRRLFWLTLGAVLGVTGYRRATRLVRSLAPGPRARELTRFVGDVREGMDLYMERHPGPAPPTLGSQQARPALAERRLPEHGLPEHGLPEHGLPEHGLTENGEDGR
jgi:hypothetical protein